MDANVITQLNTLAKEVQTVLAKVQSDARTPTEAKYLTGPLIVAVDRLIKATKRINIVSYAKVTGTNWSKISKKESL